MRLRHLQCRREVFHPGRAARPDQQGPCQAVHDPLLPPFRHHPFAELYYCSS